jgi:anthranilate synthase/aminodeoxychorismate synthase-like glutamine amidotransferase
MIAVIDNYDSFTWNLVDLLRQSSGAVKVFRNDALTAEELLAENPTSILISPGPGRPSDSGISPHVLEMAMGKIPVFGVCLGHQLIGEVLGMTLVHGAAPVHGKTSEIFHDGRGVFAGLPNPFLAMRYHSLVLASEPLPEGVEISAWTAVGEVMGIRQAGLKLEGVQFHPESVLTVGGRQMMETWVKSR